MSYIEALFLGIIQGLTEFLPVSSSGHLVLFQSLLGFKDLHHFIFFDLICHLGTLLSIMLVYRKEILLLLFNNRMLLKQVIIGTLPLFPLVFLLKPIKAAFDQPQYLGLFFITTACLLYLGIAKGSLKSQGELKKVCWKDAVAIGMFQALALLPGISRSGSTISGARLLGWHPQEALTFSFLLAIPALLGAVTLELLQFYTKSQSSNLAELSISHYAIGFAASFTIGWAALLWLKTLAAKQQFMYFVWYCLAIGMFSLIYFNI